MKILTVKATLASHQMTMFIRIAFTAKLCQKLDVAHIGLTTFKQI